MEVLPVQSDGKDGHSFCRSTKWYISTGMLFGRACEGSRETDEAGGRLGNRAVAFAMAVKMYLVAIGLSRVFQDQTPADWTMEFQEGLCLKTNHIHYP